ncbi:MAG: hypothetical protein OEM04_12145 [Flavobacteriaceae bacterium]|nr:hypothetical protein [Flavobacteriaceae bacterium]
MLKIKPEFILRFLSKYHQQTNAVANWKAEEGKGRSISSKIEMVAYTFVNSSHSPVISYLT